MDEYRIEIKKSAGKELQKIKGKDQERIIERIRGLAQEPRPSGSKKLSGEEKYRIRQGDYRILYQIFDETVLIVIVNVGHRRDVYKK
ncbi:MAG: type II toxin-antitoxin system RelE/ParE family toxin [Verrucomicrobia bacterium]|nr:type II toxin-antitoxin system RelE/ParE family toxin [Verrucomicrobiota bacterium]MDA1068477.1 type II toxin-antitoxin system RelE/ParE family toxin [Verrucomicrobiota bacterium]